MKQELAEEILSRLSPKARKIITCAECGSWLVFPGNWYCCPNLHGKLISDPVLIDMLYRAGVWSSILPACVRRRSKGEVSAEEICIALEVVSRRTAKLAQGPLQNLPTK